MRPLTLLDAFRRVDAGVMSVFGWAGDDTCGVFDIPSPTDRAAMLVIATVGEGWDHVSVSRARRCPNWPEMEYVKRLFFRDDETAMQLHVPPVDHISFCDTCLHLWRPLDREIPRPPAQLVGAGNALPRSKNTHG